MIKINLANKTQKNWNFLAALNFILLPALYFSVGVTAVSLYISSETNDPAIALRQSAKAQGMAAYEGCMLSATVSGMEPTEPAYRAVSVRCRAFSLLKEHEILHVSGENTHEVEQEFYRARVAMEEPIRQVSQPALPTFD